MVRVFVRHPDDDPVELYYLPDDFSQANDISSANPDKVKELQALFWEEADKYHVKPLLAGFSPFFGISERMNRSEPIRIPFMSRKPVSLAALR